MIRSLWVTTAFLAALAWPASAGASALSVEVWTNRGDEGVYNDGDLLMVAARANESGHLLVYEIDAEGYVNLLFPYEGSSDFIEAGETYRIPDGGSGLELVVEGPVGQGYIVAVFSPYPFQPMPWYLRPYSAQAASLGYQGDPAEEEGVTADGRIVGDPFVAMERIRRRVVGDPDQIEGFATAYTTYYLHEPVKYPRYLCYDCHRPTYWSWWDGFDPYYTTCSVFSFRVNYAWHWGPGYWFGAVPYYVYTCLPGYGWGGRYWFSGWDGWDYWCSTWGGPLRRVKTLPPVGYVPPKRYKDGTPPGFIPAHERGKRGGMILPIGRNDRARGDDGAVRVGRDARPGVERGPAREVRGSDEVRRPREDRGGIHRRPSGERSRRDDDARRPSREPARPVREPERPAREPERPAPSREPRDEGRAPSPPPPAPVPPAPRPEPDRQPRQRDERGPARGGDRGGDRGRGNRIGSVERGIERGVRRGDSAYERPGSIERRASRMIRPERSASRREALRPAPARRNEARSMRRARSSSRGEVRPTRARDSRPEKLDRSRSGGTAPGRLDRSRSSGSRGAGVERSRSRSDGSRHASSRSSGRGSRGR